MNTWKRHELPRIGLSTWILSFAWLGLGTWGLAIVRKEK